uniref:Uncharacterized protein n=1 Tax=Ursus americanus TaxID=9643 RepID=A0A452Q9R4_URSAM
EVNNIQHMSAKESKAKSILPKGANTPKLPAKTFQSKQVSSPKSSEENILPRERDIKSSTETIESKEGDIPKSSEEAIQPVEGNVLKSQVQGSLLLVSQAKSFTIQVKVRVIFNAIMTSVPW